MKIRSKTAIALILTLSAFMGTSAAKAENGTVLIVTQWFPMVPVNTLTAKNYADLLADMKGINAYNCTRNYHNISFDGGNYRGIWQAPTAHVTQSGIPLIQYLTFFAGQMPGWTVGAFSSSNTGIWGAVYCPYTYD